jgi:hypothetical protein
MWGLLNSIVRVMWLSLATNCIHVLDWSETNTESPKVFSTSGNNYPVAVEIFLGAI